MAVHYAHACTSSDITTLLQPLEDVIRFRFLPAILGRDIDDLEHA
jgi:hypothetical protein